jgi:hypothetical protein
MPFRFPLPKGAPSGHSYDDTLGHARSVEDKPG